MIRCERFVLIVRVLSHILLHHYIDLHCHVLGLRNFIAHHFTEDCLLRTPVMATAIRGQQHIFEAYENTLMCVPDFVCVLKGSHVEREMTTTGKSVRSIHFKYAFSGVNMDPSESSPNMIRGNISKLLDTTNLNEKQIKDMRSLSRKVLAMSIFYMLPDSFIEANLPLPTLTLTLIEHCTLPEPEPNLITPLGKIHRMSLFLIGTSYNEMGVK